jgi:tight adherence protein B
MSRRTRIVLTALAALTLAGTASAAAPVQMVESGGAQFPFRSYVLTLAKARALSAENVHVSENGTPVHNLSVISAQAAKDRQFGVVLAIDASDSMKGKPIAAAMAAARTFAKHRNPNQQLAIMAFNGKIDVLQDPTTSSAAINNTLKATPKLSYGTRIYDALDQAADLLSQAHIQTGSIVLLSDGADVGSASKPAVVVNKLAKQHIRAFTVGLDSSAYRPTTLKEVSARTKGSYTEAASASALNGIFDALGYQLAREYVVSYQSLLGPDKRVVVKASVDGLPGSVTSGYRTPKLDLAPAPPYHPSTVNRILQSTVTMVIVALITAGLLFWMILTLVTPRQGTLLERVGNFVAIRRRDVEEQQAEAHRRVDLLRGAESALERLKWWPRFKATLELADINASATQIVLLTGLATLVAMMLLYILIGGWGILLALSVPFIARAIIQHKLERKRRAFAEQLPDNLEVLAAALRAGHSLVGALSSVVEASSEPSNSEFRRVIAEEQLGVPIEDALGAVVVRMNNRELDQVALVARLQRETGSNAAEVIDRVIETVRARMELKRQVRTLTAQGRLSRWILTGLPILLAFALPLISPGYLDPLLHKNSGHFILVLTALMIAAGSWVIGKIVDIKV